MCIIAAILLIFILLDGFLLISCIILGFIEKWVGILSYGKDTSVQAPEDPVCSNI